MNSRFFHIRTPAFVCSKHPLDLGMYNEHRRGEKGGGTVCVTAREGDPLHVDVQVSLCHPTDMFCRKTGRESASLKVAKVVPIGNLHRELARAQYQALRLFGLTHAQAKALKRNYDYALKFFLPKE